MPPSNDLTAKQILQRLSPNLDLLRNQREAILQFQDDHIHFQYRFAEDRPNYLKWISDELCDVAKNRTSVVALGTQALIPLSDFVRNEFYPFAQPAVYFMTKIAEGSLNKKPISKDYLCIKCFTLSFRK